MTQQDLEKLLNEIQKAADNDDSESAHIFEDDMRVALLKAIANDTLKGITAKEAAKIALKSEDFEFNRYHG